MGIINAVTYQVGGGGSPVIEPLSVTENGTYTAPQGVDGYSPVTVNVGGDDDKPDITKAPAPTEYDLWAYLLIDNTLEGYPKTFTGVITGTGTVWERGHLDANNNFIVDDTVTETSSGCTLDFSDVTSRWVLYRLCTNNASAGNSWGTQLLLFPVVAVRGYLGGSARAEYAPPRGWLGMFPELKEVYWAGKTYFGTAYSSKLKSNIEFIDMSKVTAYDVESISQGSFSDLSAKGKLKTLVFPDVTEALLGFSLSYNSSLLDFDASMFDFSSVTSLLNAFSGCASLNAVNFSVTDLSSVTNVSNMFAQCVTLKTVNFSNVSFSSVSSQNNANNQFRECCMLENLILDNTVWHSYNTAFAQSPKLTHDSLVALIAALPTLSGVTRTLTLHADALARLSAAEIDVATQKGWTVA